MHMEIFCYCYIVNADADADAEYDKKSQQHFVLAHLPPMCMPKRKSLMHTRIIDKMIEFLGRVLFKLMTR